MLANKTVASTANAADQLPLLRAHMPELDSIRGLAVLGVLFYHALYWSRDFDIYTVWQKKILTLAGPGQFGVNLFFVLSGFLITGILIDSRDRSDYFRRFYLRRALRILPAYYLTLLLLVVFGITSRGFLMMSLAYSANLSGFFAIEMSYGVLWTLAVEEHFYLLWPAVVRRISQERLLWVLCALVVLCPISRLLSFQYAAHHVDAAPGIEHWTWNCLDGLASGGIIAILLRWRGWGRPELKRFCWLLIGVAALVAALGLPYGIVTRRTSIGMALQNEPWNLACGALLGMFLLLGTSRWKRLTTPSFLVFLGQISYGLYLYHLMVFYAYDWFARVSQLHSRLHLSLWAQVWTRMWIVIGVTIVVAYLSRRYFEGPFLKLKDRLPSRIRQAEGGGLSAE